MITKNDYYKLNIMIFELIQNEDFIDSIINHMINYDLYEDQSSIEDYLEECLYFECLDKYFNSYSLSNITIDYDKSEFWIDSLDLIDLDLSLTFYTDFNLSNMIDPLDIFNMFEKFFKTLKVFHKTENFYNLQLERFYNGLQIHHIGFSNEDLTNYLIDLNRSLNCELDFKGYGLLWDIVDIIEYNYKEDIKENPLFYNSYIMDLIK